MLKQFGEHELAAYAIISTVEFQQDGTPCYYAVIVKDYRIEWFTVRCIPLGSNRPCSARSPDVNPLDFFAWGYVKLRFNQSRITTLRSLQNLIRNDSVNKTLTNALECVSKYD